MIFEIFLVNLLVALILRWVWPWPQPPRPQQEITTNDAATQELPPGVPVRTINLEKHNASAKKTAHPTRA